MDVIGHQHVGVRSAIALSIVLDPIKVGYAVALVEALRRTERETSPVELACLFQGENDAYLESKHSQYPCL